MDAFASYFQNSPCYHVIPFAIFYNSLQLFLVDACYMSKNIELEIVR
jgi:hypothetical protein